MAQLKDEHLVYLSDEMYTPIHYKSMIVKEPYFEGKGNHSVSQLEAICEQYKEYCHQQAIIKQNCMKHVIELKFDVSFNKDCSLCRYSLINKLLAPCYDCTDYDNFDPNNT